MSAESSGVFTLKEINRVKIIQDIIERRMTTRRASEHLGISDRQCRQLLVRYREGGPLSLASQPTMWDAWQPSITTRAGTGTSQSLKIADDTVR